MVEMGKLNRLKVIKEVDFGLYLDGGPGIDPDCGPDCDPDSNEQTSEILLPSRYVPKNCNIGDEIKVFIYRDSEDRIIATTQKPYVMVGGFACLQVVSVSDTGAFLDWGLPKDLLVLYSEQKPKMEEDKRYVVRVYVDEESDRIAASARLDDFLHRESEDEFEVGEEVDLFVSNLTELGYQVIINSTHFAMLHMHEVIRPLKRGETVAGFIKNIREDGRIDATLHKRARDKTDDAVDIILGALRREGGFLAVTDKSSPDEIREAFSLSKAMYKKAAGSLYKRKIISIGKDGIRLIESESAEKD